MLDFTLPLAPVVVRLRTPFSALRSHIDLFYPHAQHAAGRPASFIDLDVRILHGRSLRMGFRRQARFLLDHSEPFLPLPAAQAAPLFEWGLNWALASRPLGYLVLHAAVVAREDAALVLPGAPGAGKSTLCAALSYIDDWRLLSDELAILDPDNGALQPSPRPICVKNASIDLVRKMPGVQLGPLHHDTRKGTITHAAPPDTAVKARHRSARCRWIVFPHFDANARPSCEEIGHSEAFARIAAQSFNRDRMGETGFGALCRMLADARCFAIEYDSTDHARDLIRDITSR